MTSIYVETYAFMVQNTWTMHRPHLVYGTIIEEPSKSDREAYTKYVYSKVILLICLTHYVCVNATILMERLHVPLVQSPNLL